MECGAQTRDRSDVAEVSKRINVVELATFDQ